MARNPGSVQRLVVMGALCVLLGLAIWLVVRPKTQNLEPARLAYKPRQPIETSGFIAGFHFIKPWGTEATLDECAAAYKRSFPGGMKYLERAFQQGLEIEKIMLTRANLLHAQGNPAAAYQVLEELRTQVHGTDLEAEWLYTVVYYLGISGLRLAENENCIECRGESSCIFPLAPAALHMNPKGSRLAIKHFKEYLAQFPDDVEVKWLLNLAHMTLGEHPAKVEPRHLLTFDSFNNSEFDIGRIRDIGHLVGVNRFNQSGGGIMEDFDNDGLFDIVVTCWAPSDPMAFFRNKGDGTFEDRTKAAGLEGQRGGLYCVQGDFNNDGNMDIFIPRGSWLPADLHQRPSLLRNNGDGTFTDVTKEAGMMAPMNSVSASWADYDNDGLLDLFVCCQQQPCMLYRNKGQGVFEEVAAQAGLPRDLLGILGAAWIDFDNDGYPDLFVNQGRGFMPGKDGAARLYRNDRKGRFIDMTKEMGIDGPANGFSCWAFDYDNDGWLDIFATSIVNQSLDVIVKGMMGQPSKEPTARLYRNVGGKRFQNQAKEAGLDKVYAPMGSNFGDVDNDGYLDFYLGTGAPDLSVLVPNRLFKNVAGQRFAEISASSRTGHLQKGHSVAIGDWDRNGTADIFIELGGAVPGDSYHNVLFQNPGQGNNWLSVKLVGAKTNRAALGARIKVVTAGDNPLTVHRHVSSGSSFGASPLEQHIGLGKAHKVALLEIHWPTSGTTQVFRDLDINQAVVITEFASDYQKRSWKPIAVPQ